MYICPLVKVSRRYYFHLSLVLVFTTVIVFTIIYNINTTLIRNKSYKSVCILFLKIFRRKFYFYRSHQKKGHTIRYLGKTGFPLKARDFRWYVNRLYTPPERCLCALKEVVPIQNDYYPTNYTEYPLKW